METPRGLFESGYNCAQAVLVAFAEKGELDVDQCMRVNAGFGGGMGRLQRTCGAVTGAFMVIGAILSRGDETIEVRQEKIRNMIQAFARRFEQLHGALDCGSLIPEDLNTAEGREQHKIERQTLCAGFVEDAGTILADFLRI